MTQPNEPVVWHDSSEVPAYAASTTSALTTPWRYQGELLVNPAGASDLYADGARFYAPGLGVFTQLDTSQGSALNPLSLNRFLYAAANPETMIDPSGHTTIATDDAYNSTIVTDSTHKHATYKHLSGIQKYPGWNWKATYARRAAERKQQLADDRAHFAQLRHTGEAGIEAQDAATQFAATDEASQSFATEAAGDLASSGSLCGWRGCRTKGDGDLGTGLLVGGAVGLGALACVAGGCEAMLGAGAALLAAGAAFTAADGVLSGAGAAGGVLCAAYCPAAANLIAETNAQLGGSPSGATSIAPAVEGGVPRIYRAVGPEEAADISEAGVYRTVAGQEGKYFFPTKGQADNIAGMFTAHGMGGPYRITSGSIPAAILNQATPIENAGEGAGYFIQDDLLPAITDIRFHDQ